MRIAIPCLIVCLVLSGCHGRSDRDKPLQGRSGGTIDHPVPHRDAQGHPVYTREERAAGATTAGARGAQSLLHRSKAANGMLSNPLNRIAGSWQSLGEVSSHTTVWLTIASDGAFTLKTVAVLDGKQRLVGYGAGRASFDAKGHLVGSIAKPDRMTAQFSPWSLYAQKDGVYLDARSWHLDMMRGSPRI